MLYLYFFFFYLDYDGILVDFWELDKLWFMFDVLKLVNGSS